MQHLLLMHGQHPSLWGGMSALEGSSRGSAARGHSEVFVVFSYLIFEVFICSFGLG